MTSRQIAMTEMEKMKAGLEYTYADQELIARKTQAIEWCEEYNAIDGRDYARQYECLKKMLGSVGERVWISKTFGCDCGKNIFIGNDFTGNFNLTILDIREVFIGNNVMIGRENRQRRMAWRQRHHPSGCHHRQQRRSSCRSGGQQGCSRQQSCRRCPCQAYSENRE